MCVDISVVSKQDNKTGIQRVVNNIFKEIKNNRNNVLGTQLYDSKIVIENNNVNEKNLCELELDENSHMLFLDSSWNYYRDAQVVLDKLKEKKWKVV